MTTGKGRQIVTELEERLKSIEMLRNFKLSVYETMIESLMWSFE